MKIRSAYFTNSGSKDIRQTAREKRRQAERQKLKGIKVKPDQPQPRGFSK